MQSVPVVQAPGEIKGREEEEMTKEFRWTHVDNRDQLEMFYRFVLPKIRGAARDCGYAIGLHGSVRRDLDLIAVPWVLTHVDKDTLASAIQEAACGLKSESYTWEQKPCGRLATSFPVCWTWHEEPPILSNGHIDLSVVECK